MRPRTEFSVIDQYLSLRDQLDSHECGDSIFDLDQKVPQFGLVDNNCFSYSKTGIKMENSRNFLDLENSSSYVVEELHAPSTLSDNVWSQRHARDHATVSQSTSLSGYSSNSTAVARTTFVTAAGSGCTVIEHSQPDQQLNGGESPDLLDLDKQSFYDEHGDVKPFKTEPVHSEHHYRQANCFSTGEAGVGNDTYMESWLIEQIRSEIQYDCARLTISPDPYQWSPEDVQEWVQLMCRKNKFADDCSPLFNMRGDSLCMMTEDDFKWRAQDVGSFLHQQLDVWKMACKLCPEPSYHSYPSPPLSCTDESPRCPDATNPHNLTPSSSPAPSTDSNSSTLSSYSSQGQFSHSDTMDDEVFNNQRRPGRVSMMTTPSAAPTRDHHPGQRQPKQTIHLWQFLKELLEDPESYQPCIKWIDRNRGIFKIEDSSKVAKLWGRRKNRPAMNYDKLSRSVRQYYKKGIIKKTEHSKRLVYQFCPPYL